MRRRLITGALVVSSTILLSSGTGVGQTPTIKATPSSLSFVTAQGGQIASQSLEITDTGSGSEAAAQPWRATLSDAAWLTLNLTTGTGTARMTATANPGGLVAGVYHGNITLTGGAVADQAVTIPVTLTVTSPAIPSSANLDWKNRCVDKSLNINGDFPKGFFGYGGGNWSVGPAVSTQLIKYDFAKKQAGFNTSVGAGASFRYYKDIIIKDHTGKAEEQPVKISEVKRECRETSFGSLTETSYLAAPLLSITPTIYATKPTDQSDLAVQPALLVGFLEDIINVGVGWNLTGPSGEKGHVFLLFSVGMGFKF